MANSLQMLPWFPGDFLKSTRGWTITARGIYRELLDAQWDLGGLPASAEELRGLIRASKAEWRQGWAKCLEKFPICEDGRRRNRRLEAHRSKSVELAERHAKGAKLTNAKRYAERVAERPAERDAQRSPPYYSIPSKEKDTHTSDVPLRSARAREQADPAAGGVCVDFENMTDQEARDYAARG